LPSRVIEEEKTGRGRSIRKGRIGAPGPAGDQGLERWRRIKKCKGCGFEKILSKSFGGPGHRKEQPHVSGVEGRTVTKLTGQRRTSEKRLFQKKGRVRSKKRDWEKKKEKGKLEIG